MKVDEINIITADISTLKPPVNTTTSNTPPTTGTTTQITPSTSTDTAVTDTTTTTTTTTSPISPSQTGTIIADHNSLNINSIPSEYLDKAKADYRIFYGHLSHGSQIISGMENLKGAPGSAYYFNSSWGSDFSASSPARTLLLRETSGDLGHNGDTSWNANIRAELNKPGNTITMVMWSWCSGVSDNTPAGIDIYLNTMSKLEADYPNVNFVYMTGHLDGTGTNGNLNVLNNRIRDYVRKNNKILFDFADIESYNPDGNYFLDKGAYDSCDYNGGNWADQWAAKNPDSSLLTYCDAAHTRPLNANMKARAFWWWYWPVWKVGTAKCKNSLDLKASV